jgi:hypothetical protein
MSGVAEGRPVSREAVWKTKRETVRNGREAQRLSQSLQATEQQSAAAARRRWNTAEDPYVHFLARTRTLI